MKKAIISSLLILVCFLVTAAIFSGPQTIEDEFAMDRAAKRSFDVIVRATGEMDAVNAIVVSSELEGDKSKIVWLIKDGSRVKEGEALVRFDPTEFEDRVLSLEARVMELDSTVEANAQLLAWEKSQLELEIGTMEIDLRAARLDLLKLEKGEGPLELSRLEEKAAEAEKRYEKFVGYEKELQEYFEQGLIQPYELDEAKREIQTFRREFETTGRELAAYRDYVLPTAMEKLKAKVSQARLSLEQKKKNGGYKVGKARAALTLARKELASSRLLLNQAMEDLKKTEITAPIPGMAILREGFYNGNRRKPRIGDRVLRNQAIVYVPDISSMLVRTKIREIDLHKVAPGKKTLVRVDAYPELQLSGTVDSIGAIAESDMGAGTEEKFFSIDILVKETESRLRPGMTSQVEIMCAKLDQVLTVPVYGVLAENGRKYCMVERRGGFKKTPVTVGAVNEYWAEIREGLNPGDRISLQGISVP